MALVDLNGLALTCQSAEAVQLYNEAVRLFVGHLEVYLPDVERALELDPDFVMARCFQASYYCDSLQFTNPKVDSDLRYLKSVYDSVSDRERRHIDAVKAFREQNHPKACDMWSDITVHYPEDMYAARWAFFVFRKTGGFVKMRDVMARAVHVCPKESLLYPYVLSMYAFSLEETDQRDQAEEVCRKSIAIQPKNPWGIHTMSHIFEEERLADKGVEFLNSCRQDWESGLFGSHITWHLMLFYLDLNEDKDKILQEYDRVLVPRVSTGNVLGLLDAASILWRLNLAGIDPGISRWEKVTQAFEPRIGKPQLSWLETHLMMSLCYGKVTESTARLGLAHKMIKSLEEYSESGGAVDCGIAKMLGVPLCNALLAFGEERYSDAVSLISPIKYEIFRIGGSGAQRQIFLVTLIHAAINGKQYKEAMANILELKARKPHSRYFQRLHDRVLDLMKDEQEKKM